MDRDNQPDIFPLDGASHSFDVVIRGYDRAQVHDVVDRMDGELRVALADKDASATRAAELASHLAAVQGEVESLRQKAESAAAPNFESMGARISHMLKLAEEEANDIRRIASEDHTRSQSELQSTAQEAARLRSEAQDEARKMTEDTQAESVRVTQEAQDAAAKTVASAQAEADALNERARASAEQAELDSKSRVAKIEEDFQLAQKARRAEAARVEQERDQSSRRDAQNRIEQAQRKSDDMVGAAEQRVTDLDAQRAELHNRLTKVRELLGGLPEIGTATVIEPRESPAKTPPGPSQNQGSTSGPNQNQGSTSGPNQKQGPTSDPNQKQGPTTDPNQKQGPTSGPNPSSGSNAGPAAKAPEDVAGASGDQAAAAQNPTGDSAAAVSTDAQGTPPPPPAKPSAPSWPVNSPTQAIPIPRQG